MRELQRSLKGEQSLGAAVYKEVFRRVLFKLGDPEDAHKLAMVVLRRDYPAKVLDSYFNVESERLGFVLANKVSLNGPIGLAAGFDKNAEMLQGLSHIFDYITAGTMLPYEWAGNPKRREGLNGVENHTRRIIRLESEEGMLNCVGFPFDGLTKGLARVGKYIGSAPINLSVAVRPVEGADQTEAIGQFKQMLSRIAPLIPGKIQMIEVDFSSPNTRGITVFFEEGIFESLTTLLTKRKPFDKAILLLKMPPHLDDATKERNLNVASRWIRLGGDGITAINTVVTEDSRLSVGVGGKSGKPIYGILKSNIKDYREQLGNTPIINAVGGITSDKLPELMIEGGADTVQVFTPFIYEGPSIVRDSKIALVKALDEHGYSSIRDLRAERLVRK